MNPEPATIRASRLIGRPVGTRKTTVADLITETGTDGRERVTTVLVVRRPWGRLLGCEGDEVSGPRLLETFARWVLRRHATTMPVTDLSLEPR